MDNFTKAITISFCILAGAVIAFMFFRLLTDKVYFWVELATGVTLLLAIAISYLFKPSNYVVTSYSFIINRPLGEIEIPLNNIESAEKVEDKDMRFSLRLFGVGGLFGFYGIFSNKKFGRMRWYASRRNRFVLIKTTGNKKIVITPDDISLAEMIMKNKAA